jgi:hypothetical protein
MLAFISLLLLNPTDTTYYSIDNKQVNDKITYEYYEVKIICQQIQTW